MARIALPTSERPQRHASYRTPLIFAVSFLLLVALAFSLDSTYTRSFHPLMSTPSTAPPAAGWHSRAIPHPDRATFKPSLDNLAFGVLFNAPTEPEGFTTAFFKPDIAIDAMGRVLRVSPNDWSEIVSAVESVTVGGEVPEAGGFRNQWRVKQARTGYPIDWIRVPVIPAGEFKDLSIYGFDGTTAELNPPVHGLTTLPPILMKLFNLVKEGREGYERRSSNRDVIDKVTKVLGD